MTIFTIGYEGLDIDGFLALLRLHRIDTIVDIREFPVSRKPGFSKNGLANTLHMAGFDYVHHVRLGCPKPIRDRYHSDHDWSRYTKGFVEYLRTQGDAVADLAARSAHANCALLCYEKNPNFCHRSLVAEEVRRLSGFQVMHIRSSELKRAKLPVQEVLALV
jgi:uncharacterized protein (DUF488 family)